MNVGGETAFTVIPSSSWNSRTTATSTVSPNSTVPPRGRTPFTRPASSRTSAASSRPSRQWRPNALSRILDAGRHVLMQKDYSKARTTAKDSSRRSAGLGAANGAGQPLTRALGPEPPVGPDQCCGASLPEAVVQSVLQQNARSVVAMWDQVADRGRSIGTTCVAHPASANLKVRLEVATLRLFSTVSDYPIDKTMNSGGTNAYV